MKISSVAAGLAAIGLAVMLGGCLGRDPLYAIAPGQVNDVLDRTYLPIMVFGEPALTAKHWRVNAATTMWAVESDKHVELLRLSATTTAEGIHYDVLPPESAVRDRVAQQLKDNSAYRDLFRSALAEQVDANLNNRGFSIGNIAMETARVTLKELPNIRQSFDNAEKEHVRRQQEVIDRAYANER
jgi:hypothetical protein